MKKLFGMPHFVDEENKIVYIKCSSAITAMGISALVSAEYPGYIGKLVTEEHLNTLKS